MEASETKATVEDLEQLKLRSRGDRRATSWPLFVFGVITLLGSAFTDGLALGAVYWGLAFPAGFGFLFWLQRRRAARTGVGEGREPYGLFALGWLVLVVPVGLILAILAPLALVAAGLLAVAAHQGNRYLAVCAVIYGTVGTLEFPFYVISNRLYEFANLLGLFESKSGYFDWAGALVAVLLAAFLLIAGSVAWRREMRSA